MADQQNTGLPPQATDMAETPEMEPNLAEQTPLEKKNAITIIREWPMPRKIGFGLIIAVLTALFAVIIIQARTVNEQLLYANLPPADASQVVNWLKNQQIPYSLKNHGKDIWIPAAQIYDVRLDLAANNLPSGSGVGFEIFDKQSFALTDYVQKVNMTRALQGELARTIASLDPVEIARVHLAIPEKRIFNKQPKKPSASVILTMAPGRKLKPQQVQGIVHLVASSIPGLEPDHVKVIDQNGVVLEREKKPGKDDLLTKDMLNFQQQVERRMEKRVQELLDVTMGKDNSMVRISAVLDFAKVERTKEFFDGDDPVIRSQQTKQEFNTRENAGGIPGVESNMQGNNLEANNGVSSLSKNSKIVNYEISKTISKIVNPIGTITKLSVSVLVADKFIPSKEEGKEPTTEPRSQEELLAIENMVAKAIGLDTERGDMISVQSMPFVIEEDDAFRLSTAGGEDYYQYLPFIRYALIAISAFLIYLLLMRPVVKTVKGEVKDHYQTVEEMQRQIEEEKEQEALRIEEEKAKILPVDEAINRARKEVMEDQMPAAFILKGWIQQGG